MQGSAGQIQTSAFVAVPRDEHLSAARQFERFAFLILFQQSVGAPGTKQQSALKGYIMFPSFKQIDQTSKFKQICRNKQSARQRLGLLAKWDCCLVN